MPNTLNVSLDENTTPWTVDIDQKNNANHVGQNGAAQTITWQLHGNAASGNIISFNWLTAPPSGIFTTPSISSNGNSMTMSDLNNSASTAGDWIYQLTIEVGGNNYSTTASTTTGTTNNPSIKNN
ncbi:hypothetical protein ACXU4B_12720 [Dyella soli]|uniref:Uncharacterized protein n=1 Tax=Dyella soli TaxID=522319 RepID=A0A4R0YII1_9GAMM|nr:hypothetical protein [Dyella soli]TCI06992.1 hypothetical protein EZM97_30720 [Dyella soli]